MNVAIRNKKLKARLLDVRLGPGAAILPSNIKRINLDFGYRIEGGNRGPRKFWRECLPRLKYHNPAVSMTVNRSSNQQGPALLSVFFTQPPESDRSTISPSALSSTKASPSPSSYDPSIAVESIEMRNLQETEILERLLVVTKARPYEASPEEQVDLQEVKDFEERSQADREAQNRLNRIKAEEKAMLEQAKGAVS